MPTALITGVTGQDGAYLSRLLLEKGYTVHGIRWRSSIFNTQRVDGIYADPYELPARFTLHYGGVTDATNIIRIGQQVQPDEIYNLAAQSNVQESGRHGALGRVRWAFRQPVGPDGDARRSRRSWNGRRHDSAGDDRHAFPW